ncbi:hypothetical protein SAV14893_079950 [Streptomyces avermitilis]|uniref:Uncharacterized protein n=1 Tax=Streptomyces avermitilis TaxID=33903 RepID=A0A4D4M9P7_STRAX|nr:hypothetical protein SAV14893_079950 [Streptomyces avermitilis]GDY71023.1 hypothetical protein SAV31267_005080 [Streptomyces avermitilis]
MPVGIPGHVREPVPLLPVPLAEALAVGEAIPLHADHADTLADPAGAMPGQYREPTSRGLAVAAEPSGRAGHGAVAAHVLHVCGGEEPLAWSKTAVRIGW